MRVLVACEFSGIVRDAFRAKGHDAWSVDLLPSERPGPHYQDDAIKTANSHSWDLMIAHPPCTDLSRAGARWWASKGEGRLGRAAQFVFLLRDAPIERIAIENPIGQLNHRWRYPDQTIQPFWFGDPFSKATCLWLKGLPALAPTCMVEPIGPYLPSNTGLGARIGQRSAAGVARAGSPDRSRTFQGIADAMAAQWG